MTKAFIVVLAVVLLCLLPGLAWCDPSPTPSSTSADIGTNFQSLEDYSDALAKTLPKKVDRLLTLESADGDNKSNSLILNITLNIPAQTPLNDGFVRELLDRQFFKDPNLLYPRSHMTHVQFEVKDSSGQKRFSEAFMPGVDFRDGGNIASIKDEANAREQGGTLPLLGNTNMRVACFSSSPKATADGLNQMLPRSAETMIGFKFSTGGEFFGERFTWDSASGNDQTNTLQINCTWKFDKDHLPMTVSELERLIQVTSTYDCMLHFKMYQIPIVYVINDKHGQKITEITVSPDSQ